ncbi:hypothetical protein JXA32_04035 [Candidatus Sumerlaeota bacterium]|nr:hypothetical protein [Candidatus Sumerlaeota bacterium]
MESTPGIKIHKFPISAATPYCAQWRDQRIYQHGWFFTRIGDAHETPGLEIFYIKGTAEHTAYAANGTMLWQWSDPQKRPSSVRVDSNVPLFDFDGDGRLELVVFRHKDDEQEPRLCRLDAATGETLAWSPETVKLDPKWGDNRVSLVPMRLEGGQWGLALHDDYAQISVFDAELNCLWTLPVEGLGHTTIPVDLDGDGVDELYCGVLLLDAAGKVIWDRTNLLEGTGESHPDSNPVFTMQGKTRLFFGPGGRILDAKGEIVWQLDGQQLKEIQSARVLTKRGADPALVFTDLPARRDLTWRGMKQRAVDSVNYFLNNELEVIGSVAGCHTPSIGDWNGDGNDELVLLDEDLCHLLVINQKAETIARIPIQERVYVSDIRLAPVLPDAKGEQIIIHEWSEDWTKANFVIIEDTNAGDDRAEWNQLKSARWTTY